MKLTNAEIQKSIAELPDNIKQAVVSFDWATEILGIAHEHNMQIDDADDFRHQTLLVILGKIPAEDYEKNLASELGLSRQTAASLVGEANERIFLELQKRAFSRNEVASEPNNDNRDGFVIASDSDAISDPYQEPIEHHEIKNILSSEGIHLVDEHEPEVFDNDLHDEVSAILSEVNRPAHIELDPSFSSESIHPKDNEIISPENNQKGTINSYNEPIEETDLKGVRNHSIDTSIIKTKYHNNPDNIFNNDTPKKTLDLGQGDYKIPTLDKHMLENPFITKPDIIDASPTENEQIKQDGDFLEHLKKEV